VLNVVLDFTAPASVTPPTPTPAPSFHSAIVKSPKNDSGSGDGGSSNGGTPAPAPAPSAFGDLSAYTFGQTTNGLITITAVNFAAGTYTVTATDSTGASYTLGTFSVPAVQTPPTLPSSWWQQFGNVGQTGLGGFFGGFGNSVTVRFGGQTSNPLPAGLNPLAIASVSIDDSNGNVVLTASTSPVQEGALSEGGPLTPGTTDPNATGYVRVSAFAFNGTDAGFLSLFGKGLTAGATYTYSIDGTSAGTVTANANGVIHVFASTKNQLTGVNLFDTTSVTVTDASNNVVLSATFQ
jgi:hypothetical protein